MKNSILSWIILIGIAVVILISLRHQASQETVPLSEIFPDDTVITEEEPEPITTPPPSKSSPVKPSKPSAPATTATVTPSAPVGSGELENVSFTIQVLSSKDQAALEKKNQALRAKGFDAYISNKDLGDKGLWYRLYVGKFNTKAEADAVLKTLKSDYPDSFIIAPNKKK